MLELLRFARSVHPHKGVCQSKYEDAIQATSMEPKNGVPKELEKPSGGT